MKKTLFMFLAVAFMSLGFHKAQAEIVIPQVPAELQETVNGYVQALLANPADEQVMKDISKNKAIKKNKDVLVAIGYKFLDNNLFGNAIGLAKKVYEMDPTFLPAIYLEGDAYFKMANNNAYGMAATKYEEAKTVDPNSLDPYLKLVGVYRYINPDYAIELMQEIKDKKTDDPKINQVLGTLYYQLADTVNARNFYNKYFATFPDGQGDITVQREYSIILFMAKDYKNALAQANKFLKTNPEDPVLRRIVFLSSCELGDDSLTQIAHDRYFGHYPDSVYQEIDYRYEGQYYNHIKNYKGAIAAYKAAAKIDTADAATQYNLSKVYEKVKDYNDAIAAYKRFMVLAKKEGDVNETFRLGRVYYNAANADTDSISRQKFIDAGDKVYAWVDEQMKKDGEPSYQGIFWRSRINQLINRKKPNKLAADYMIEATKRLADPKFAGEDYNAHRAQAYAYIAWYDMDTDNFAGARENAQLALKNDEEQPLAQNVIKYLDLIGK